MTRQPSVVLKIKFNRWKYYEHASRMQNDKWPNQILEWQPEE